MGNICCEDPLVGGHDDKIKHALKVLIAASLAESKHIGSRTRGREEAASARCINTPAQIGSFLWSCQANSKSCDRQQAIG